MRCSIKRGSRNGVSARRVHYPEHNELRDFEAEMLRMVCNDVEVEPVLQEVTGETIDPVSYTHLTLPTKRIV